MTDNAAPFTAPGGTHQALLDALRERLAQALEHLKLPTDVDGEAPRAPDIHDGYLPPKRSRGQKRGDFPYVIVRPLGGVDSAHNEAKPRVRLVIGTCSQQPDGYRDWLAVLERLRGDLLRNPNIGGRFRLEHPFTWDLPEDQLEPQFIGVVELNFAMPGIADRTGLNFEHTVSNSRGEY